MSFFKIAGVDGFGFMGQAGGSIGPARAIYDYVIPDNLAGTVSVAVDQVTGVATTFLADFEVGDYIYFGTSPTPQIFKISAIASDTLMTIINQESFEAVNVTIPALTTYKKWVAMDLGKTSEAGVNIKLTEKSADVKSSDDGDVPINTFSTGTELTIEFELLECSLERISKVLEGAVSTTKDVNGRIVGMAFGDRVGRNFKQNAKNLRLVAYRDGGLSEDDEDVMDIFKVHFVSAIELQRDATNTHKVKLTGKCFKDESKKINGKAQYMAVNPDNVVFD